MTNTAIALSDETLTALDVLVKGRFSTVVVETQNSVYTVVVRRDYATVIHNTRKPLVGTDVYVIGLKTGHPTLLLRNNHDDLTVLHTTAIQRAYVLEN